MNSLRSPKRFPAPDLEQQTRESLDFPTILQLFACKAQTREGKALLQELNLMEPQEQRDHYAELDQWLSYLADLGQLRFPEIPAKQKFVRQPLLNPFDSEDLRSIRDFLSFFSQVSGNERLTFAGLPQSTPEIETLTRRLEQLFKPDGGWREDISPLFAQLIRQLESTRHHLDQTMASLVRQYADVLNEGIVFERNNRKVLAVKQNFRGRVKGILQDFSSSGNTLYLEPEQAVGYQNQLTRIQVEIEEELWRIRCEVTQAVLAHPLVYEEILPAIAHMDMMQGLALAAVITKSIPVLPNEEEELFLLNARHPYLDQLFADFRERVLERSDNSRMVAFSLRLDADLRGLVISGANTGGKTVTLKTTGLMAWMANSGLPIPVDEGSKVPFYRSILADIGDHQSLSHNLSTFASHLANLEAVFRVNHRETLVLLDELGSGTDPREGNALSQAVIEEILERGFHLLVTTHQQILCTLALNHPQLDNGSMVFDAHRSAPTYRFDQGVPGRSHALETALNSGLPGKILARAQNLIDEDQIDIQAAILKLQEQHKVLRKQQARMRKEELRFYRQAQDTRQKTRELEQLQDELRQTSRTRMEKVVAQAEKELRSVLSDLSSQKQRKNAVSKFAETRREVLEPFKAPEKLETVDIQPSELPPDQWKAGDAVFLKTWLKEATLQAVDRKKARLDCNGKILTVAVTDVIHLKTDQSKTIVPKVAEFVETKDDQALSVELRLLGRHVEDALLDLDHAIDRALREGLPFLKVIHGHGSGALKNAIRSFLRKHMAKDSFRVELDEHNDGVTDLHFG